MEPDDQAHMQAALALAARGLGETWPNPTVGCVLVRAGRVVGRGRTAASGRPHAEMVALAEAGRAAQGATAYVTLEPCAHHGQTPPCADALVAAGLGRVVVALADPDPRVNGRGLARLRDAGIAVERGLLAEAAAALNAGFLSRVTKGRPLVTVKLASTLDGQIATETGESQWITAEPARRVAHQLRANHDAILVGAGTVAADDPRLTCRLDGARSRKLLRLVADSHLRTRLTSTLMATARDQPTWLLTRRDADPARVRAAQSAGAEILFCEPGSLGIDLSDALARLAERGLTRVLLEGGAGLVASALRAGHVDRVVWFHAPAVMGGDGYDAVRGYGVARLADMARFRRLGGRPVGPDMVTELERITD